VLPLSNPGFAIRFVSAEADDAKPEIVKSRFKVINNTNFIWFIIFAVIIFVHH
jgi:hypothetical protein